MLKGLPGKLIFLVMTHDYRQEVTFYPNPVMDKLNVRMGREVEGTIYLTFSTLDGQLVKKVNAPIGPFAPGGSRPFRFEKRNVCRTIEIFAGNLYPNSNKTMK